MSERAQALTRDQTIEMCLVMEVRLPMLEYDFSKQPNQDFDEATGEHGGYEMGVRASSKETRRSLDFRSMFNGFFQYIPMSLCTIWVM